MSNNQKQQSQHLFRDEFKEWVSNINTRKMMSIMPNTLYVKEHRNSKEPKEYWLYTTIGVERYKADELYGIGYYDEDYEHICEFRGSKTRIIYTKMLLRLYDNGYLPEFSHHKQVG